MTDEIIDGTLKATSRVTLKDLKNKYEIDDVNYDYILNQSYNLMPILYIQYKGDFKIILKKIEEYQILLINDKKIKKKK